ncbi:MAG: hypothetical protein PVF58_13230 [Candidatus Methanofastidiosia archaeon]|jgi:hypothetical protein
MGEKANKAKNRNPLGKSNRGMSVLKGKEREKSTLGWGKQVIFVVFFLALFLILMYLLLNLWPSSIGVEEKIISAKVETWNWWIFRLEITREIQFIFIVAIMGALGGCVYAMRAFAYHVSRKSFECSYTCWYVLHPFVGSILAVIFYFAFRAAFFSSSADTKDLNIFGIAAVGGIVGLFSWETIKKLKDLFERVLPAEGDE